MNRTLPFLTPIVLLVLLHLGGASADEAGMHHHSSDMAPSCGGTGLDCATTATPLFTHDGAFRLIWSAGGQVLTARSDDLGQSFGPAIAITPHEDRIDGNGDGRPVLVEDARGRLLAAYSRFKDDNWNAQVMIATSSDGGASFSTPISITDDPASQRFVAFGADPKGGLFAAWIDKRTVAAARAAGIARPGAALAFAWSDDGGRSFGPSRIFHEASCECCRLAVAIDRQGRPAVLFRSLFDGGVRDHAIIVFHGRDEFDPAVRVSDDNWVINGCPHQGPSLAIGPGGVYHAAWFTQGSARQGLFYARSLDGGRSFSAPIALSSPDRHPARASLLARDKEVWLAWKEFDGQKTTVRAMRSSDDGQNWSPAKIIAETEGNSDHPLLVADEHRVYLSWLTHPEGYHLIPLEPAP